MEKKTRRQRAEAEEPEEERTLLQTDKDENGSIIREYYSDGSVKEFRITEAEPVATEAITEQEPQKGIYTKEEVEDVLESKGIRLSLDVDKGIYTVEELENLLK